MIANITNPETMRESDPYLAAFDRFEETEAYRRAFLDLPRSEGGIVPYC